MLLRVTLQQMLRSSVGTRRDGFSCLSLSGMLKLRLIVLVLLVSLCSCLEYDPPEVATTKGPEPTLLESLRQMVGDLMDRGSHEITRQVVAAEISSQCSLGLLKLMRGIRNLDPWAVRRK